MYNAAFEWEYIFFYDYWSQRKPAKRRQLMRQILSISIKKAFYFI